MLLLQVSRLQNLASKHFYFILFILYYIIFYFIFTKSRKSNLSVDVRETDDKTTSMEHFKIGRKDQ